MDHPTHAGATQLGQTRDGLALPLSPPPRPRTPESASSPIPAFQLFQFPNLTLITPRNIKKLPDTRPVPRRILKGFNHTSPGQRPGFITIKSTLQTESLPQPQR